MKDKKDVKISFHTLIQRMWKVKSEDQIVENPFYIIQEIIEYVSKLPKKHKFYDLKNNKFCFLESVKISTENEVIISGVFKSARNEFRPNIINKRTGNERPNPKDLSEGDIEKTHFLIKFSQNEVFLFFEHNFFGLTINNLINYFTFFCDKYFENKGLKRNFTIIHSIIPRNNFLTELERLKRTRIAEIYFDKKLLGSDSLNFSNRTASLKKDLILTAKAMTNESISGMVIDCFNLLNIKDSNISKVRVYGMDDENNEIILDTSFMSKIEYTNVDLDLTTGELNSTQLLSGLKIISNSF